MAGIYVHIPFCVKKCAYCDFYSVGNMSTKMEMLSAIKRDIELRKEVLNGAIPKTIYFGGGTPSQYSPVEIQSVIEVVKSVFNVFEFDEITIEINPEDVTLEYIEELKKSDINRISMGVQSFYDETLKFMKRRHSSDKAIWAIKELQKNGYDNISIDLIYGVPKMSRVEWLENIRILTSLNVQHISAYHLTIEPQTYFGRLLEKGYIEQVDESVSDENYFDLISALKNYGFVHYEISNFACDIEHVSKHNSSYWSSIPYLGVGPSAHSFNGSNVRSWSISSNAEYIKGVLYGDDYVEFEKLTNDELYDEFIMLSLRCERGVSFEELKNRFKDKLELFEKRIESFVRNGDLIIEDSRVKIDEQRYLISDYIISEIVK